MQMLAALESIMQNKHTEGGVLSPLLYTTLSPEYSFAHPPAKPGSFSGTSKKH